MTVIDNGSEDSTVSILQNYENKRFGQFQYFLQKDNLGFGRANNIGVQNTNQEFIFFLNIDTEIDHDAISELMNSVERSSSDCALWESRQFPYEHPKLYNPVDLVTSWASGACILVKRSAFVDVGMFDENIFMYGEDVDLSWRLRALKYKLVYVPKSIVHHYTYDDVNKTKVNQYYNSIYNNLMLRYKYGKLIDILKGYILLFGLLAVKGPSNNHRLLISGRIVKSIKEGLRFRSWRREHKGLSFQPDFKLWDYETNREGAFYTNKLIEEKPLVSILIRTCNRPTVLKEALISCRNQTYPNLEIVVVEDGRPLAEELIKSEFQDLNIVYIATGIKVGRCEAGNLALRNASGKYFNFLDDDDLLYADHIEVLVQELIVNDDKGAAYSISFEVPTKIVSHDPYQYEELFHFVQHNQPFDLATLIHHNYFPIQTVLFKRTMYEELGGFDPSLEVLEDWDLWLKYASHRPFLYVNKLTSLYHVPADSRISSERQHLFDTYLELVRKKHINRYVKVTFAELLKMAQITEERNLLTRIKTMRFRTLLHKVKHKLASKFKKALN